MNHKVLLADDSLTIQKVIKITLANQPYDITECSSEEELFQKLIAVQPKIVFLDFNLSEKYTGYELTAKIKSICPGTKILLLLGTFDTVDDATLEKCGASDKIVKPFDSNKFIAICKQLSATLGDTATALSVSASTKSTVDEAETEENGGTLSGLFPSDEDLAMPEVEDPEDQWKMKNSAMKVETVKEVAPVGVTGSKLDALSKEINDWGMSVPNVINDKSSHEIRFDLPPIIGEVKSLDEQRQKVEARALAPAVEEKKPEFKYPETSDLDYPTVEEIQGAPVSKGEEKPKEPAQLVSLDIMNERPMDLQLEGNYVEDVANISIIEAQIKDEVEENLWCADEFEDLKREVSTKIEEIKEELEPTITSTLDENIFRPIDDPQSIDWTESTVGSQEETPIYEPKFSASLEQRLKTEKSSVATHDMEALRTEMNAMVKRYVKEYMDEMFSKNVEKISWEVIPDLAENLIRQELGKIANKVINDQE